MDPVTAILGGIKLWTTIKPVKILRNRRRAKRGLPPLEEHQAMAGEKVTVTMADGTQVERTEPLIDARTSTKVAVGTGAIAAFPAVELLSWIQAQDIPIAWIEAATNSPYFIYYGSLAISYLVTRYSKSPLGKQGLI